MRFALPALIASTLTLAACTGTPAQAPAPVATVAPAATADPAHTDAGSGDPGLDRFVAAVQQKLPDVAMDRRDEEVAELGETACDALAAGQDPAAVVRELADEGVPADQARTLFTLARTTACHS